MPPVQRRLTLKTERPAYGGDEFLFVSLDDASNDFAANGTCALPDPSTPLGNTGLTVEQFLEQFRQGERGLTDAAKVFGRLLHDCLFPAGTELGDAWRDARNQATNGLRLEICLPVGESGVWRGRPLALLPFELLADEHGFLFRRTGWRTVRAIRNLRPRRQRTRPAGQTPAVLLAWANVSFGPGYTLPQEDFTAHEHAVRSLEPRARCLEPVRNASRRHLAAAITQQQPDILVWVGHGVADGSALLLHDDRQTSYPLDLGAPTTAADFAATVRGNNGAVSNVDVAFLWSCHGAGVTEPLSLGVAEALLHPEHGDLTAVLAAYSALESSAIAAFSGEVITAWAADPEGDLEQALTRARAGLDEQSLTWARPVLFSRAPRSSPAFQLDPLADAPPTVHGSLHLLPPPPQAAAQIFGRDDLLALINQDLRHHAVVVLEGLPGIGKTELALAVAHQHQHAGAAVAFVEITPLLDYSNLLLRLGQWRGMAQVDSEADLLRAYRDIPLMLVVDNAEDMLEASADMRTRLSGLLQGLAGVSTMFRCIVTSRRALGAAGAWVRVHEVPPLDTAAARALFVAGAGPRLPPEHRHGADLDALLRELDGVPRALLLMAGQLKQGVDLGVLRARLLAHGVAAITSDDLFGVPVAEALDQKVRKERLLSSLNLACRAAEAQDDQAGLLFDVLGAFPAGLDQALLPFADQPWLHNALAVLLEHHLVSLRGEARRLVQPAPIRSYAHHRLLRRPNEAVDSILTPLYQRLAATTDQVRQGLGSTRSAPALRWLLIEEANLLYALDRLQAAASARHAALFASIAADLAFAFGYGGRSGDGLAQLGPRLVSATAVWPDSRTAADALQALGDLKRRTADLAGARADYAAALVIYRAIAERLGEANTLKALGDLKQRTDDLAGARADYAAALLICRAIEERLGEANTLRALGDLKRRTADLAGARADYAAALVIYRAIEERLGEANILQALGDLKQRTDDLDGARADYAAALLIYRAIEERLGEANTLQALGDLKQRTDDLAGARADYAAALVIYRAIAERLGEANTLLALGDLKQRTADLAGARTDYAAALRIYRAIGDRLGEANTLQRLGLCHLHAGAYAEAFRTVLAAMRISEAIQDGLGVAAAHAYLARITRQDGRVEQAAALAGIALRHCRRLGDRYGQKIALTDLGQILGPVNEGLGLAALYLTRDIAHAIGDPQAAELDAGFDHIEHTLPPAEWADLSEWLAGNAQTAIDDLLDQLAAAVAAGELDLYAVPEDNHAE